MSTSNLDETPAQPWAEPPPREQPDERPVKEPLFNAPWQAVAVTALIVVGYGVQTLFPADAVLGAYAFAPINLAPGLWETAITAIFLHGGWAHALMNGAFALAFATPVARFFGPKLEGALLFFGLYLLAGVLANLAYAAVHLGSHEPLVGASGAVSGFMGAAARLIGGRGRVGPVFSKAVLALGGSWIAVNLIIAVVGGSFFPGAGQAGVAWEAHLAGFAAGVLLIGPLGRLTPRN
jgi:membrane associated rhomboid family serine protease